jgi:hypothetical protein
MPKTARVSKDQQIEEPDSVASAPQSETTERVESRPTPSSEEISRRAYEIFLERGGTDGNDIEDWLRAERELTKGE